MRWILIMCLFFCYCDQQRDINKLESDNFDLKLKVDRIKFDIDMMDTKVNHNDNRVDRLAGITSAIIND